MSVRAWGKTEDDIDYRDGHPVINVKVRNCPSWDGPEEIANEAWESVQMAWWEWATEIAHDAGYSGVFSEGRSDGWLAPFFQGYPARKFHRWPGQGGECGYPRYPDLTDIGERSRFLAFRRRIMALLASVPADLLAECEYLSGAV